MEWIYWFSNVTSKNPLKFLLITQISSEKVKEHTLNKKNHSIKNKIMFVGPVKT